MEGSARSAVNPLQKWEEHIRAEKESNAQSSSAAQLAWQRWAAVPRKARTVLKQANPEGVAILELSYLQFMEDVGPPARFFWTHGTRVIDTDICGSEPVRGSN